MGPALSFKPMENQCDPSLPPSQPEAMATCPAAGEGHAWALTEPWGSRRGLQASLGSARPFIDLRLGPAHRRPQPTSGPPASSSWPPLALAGPAPFICMGLALVSGLARAGPAPTSGPAPSFAWASSWLLASPPPAPPRGPAPSAHLQRLAQLQVEGDDAHALQPGREACPGRRRIPRLRGGRVDPAAGPRRRGAARPVHGSRRRARQSVAAGAGPGERGPSAASSRVPVAAGQSGRGGAPLAAGGARCATRRARLATRGSSAGQSGPGGGGTSGVVGAGVQVRAGAGRGRRSSSPLRSTPRWVLGDLGAAPTSIWSLAATRVTWTAALVPGR